jgi:hypothetical protein
MFRRMEKRECNRATQIAQFHFFQNGLWFSATLLREGGAAPSDPHRR